MDMVRPTLLISLLLAGLTLVYSGRWAGMDPRPVHHEKTVQVADAGSQKAHRTL